MISFKRSVPVFVAFAVAVNTLIFPAAATESVAEPGAETVAATESNPGFAAYATGQPTATTALRPAAIPLHHIFLYRLKVSWSTTNLS